jgi:hypothetical protein
MWGALSDESTGLSFTAVDISHLYLQFYMSAFYIVFKSPVPCGYVLLTVLHITVVCMYVQYIHCLCQSRLGTADHALAHVAHVTTAA